MLKKRSPLELVDKLDGKNLVEPKGNELVKAEAQVDSNIFNMSKAQLVSPPASRTRWLG